VVEILEDVNDYSGFEAAVIADYDARTAVERELVLRLASLLWRLRRATAIETDLLRVQAEILRERRSAGRAARSPTSPVLEVRPIQLWLRSPTPAAASPGPLTEVAAATPRSERPSPSAPNAS
jgi:hypothetical protein